MLEEIEKYVKGDNTMSLKEKAKMVNEETSKMIKESKELQEFNNFLLAIKSSYDIKSN